MYDVAIGEEFSIVSDRFKVVEQPSGLCEGCALLVEKDHNLCGILSCAMTARLDGKNVIFEKVLRETS